ncbi:MAG: DUF6882 domain-containing protein [Gulosibacter sp.]|uniref:DUF6882 domain-containing protein n=1 Tax=Gulosibacter sp. TaxID=2817531 RepID=UPI003F90B923
MVSKQLRDLAAMSLFTHVHAEAELNDSTLDSQWQVDLPQASITFNGHEGTRTYPVQLLGSIAHAAGTWMWGWQEANESRFPAKALSVARRVREAGLQRGIPELTEPVVVLSDTPSLILRLAAETIGDLLHTITVDAGRGLSLVLAIDAGPLRPLDSQSLLSATMHGADLGITDDHRSALETYAKRLGLDCSTTAAEGSRLRLGCEIGAIEFETDESGRLTKLQEASLSYRHAG